MMGKDSAWKYSDVGRRIVNPLFQSPDPLAISEKKESKENPSLNPLPILEKKFTQPQDEPHFVFSEFPQAKFINMELPWSNGTTNGNESEEMHEDTDEIDALLYSDSDDEASTGHSPLETMTGVSTEEEEVASCLALPAKRKRIDPGRNVDIPSSAGAQSMVSAYAEDDAESCCEGGDEQCVDEDDENMEMKRAKMERIQETVGMLRRIIPGGQGKDAAAVIDEAISYLRTLKLQALAMEDGSI